MIRERYAIYVDKNRSPYLAADDGNVFVKTIACSITDRDAAQRMTDRANDGVTLQGVGWRARIARRVLRVLSDPQEAR